MMRFLNASTEESVSYGHFRNLMLLLPSDGFKKIHEVSDLKLLLWLPFLLLWRYLLAVFWNQHWLTRVQASTLSLPEILSKLPQFGVRGFYRGSVPAIIGQFSSHGLLSLNQASFSKCCTNSFRITGSNVQSIASFCSTFLGTAVRIPCEVMKQRLQAGLFSNVVKVIVGTWQQDGLGSFFRETGATLFQEVPFYDKNQNNDRSSWSTCNIIVGCVLYFTPRRPPWIIQRSCASILLDCSFVCHEFCWL